MKKVTKIQRKSTAKSKPRVCFQEEVSTWLAGIGGRGPVTGVVGVVALAGFFCSAILTVIGVTEFCW